MSSRKELKERRRREREEAERRAHDQARRRLRLRLYAALAAAAAALAVGAAVVAFDGGDDPKEVFAAKPEGLAERLQKARLALGSDHFHPTIRVVASGKQIAIPDDIGAGEGTESAPLHIHPGDEQLHAEGLQAGRFTLAQFMQVWGVPLSATRLGPYRADSRRKVVVFAKAQGQDRFRQVRDFDGLRLAEGDEVYVTYGTREQSPIVL